MSEYCHQHRKDYNLMTGCEGCLRDAQPIEHPRLQQIAKPDPKVAVLEALRKQETMAHEVVKENLNKAIAILQAIMSRGYWAYGEHERAMRFLETVKVEAGKQPR